jgi:hypothetical protein
MTTRTERVLNFFRHSEVKVVLKGTLGGMAATALVAPTVLGLAGGAALGAVAAIAFRHRSFFMFSTDLIQLGATAIMLQDDNKYLLPLIFYSGTTGIALTPSTNPLSQAMMNGNIRIAYVLNTVLLSQAMRPAPILAPAAVMFTAISGVIASNLS